MQPRCVVIVAALFLAACSASGSGISSQTTRNQLIPGKTTQAEVRALLGEPVEAAAGVWTYVARAELTQGSRITMNTLSKEDRLVVRFTPAGVVQSSEYTDGPLTAAP